VVGAHNRKTRDVRDTRLLTGHIGGEVSKRLRSVKGGTSQPWDCAPGQLPGDVRKIAIGKTLWTFHDTVRGRRAKAPKILPMKRGTVERCKANKAACARIQKRRR